MEHGVSALAYPSSYTREDDSTQNWTTDRGFTYSATHRGFDPLHRLWEGEDGFGHCQRERQNGAAARYFASDQPERRHAAPARTRARAPGKADRRGIAA